MEYLISLKVDLPAEYTVTGETGVSPESKEYLLMQKEALEIAYELFPDAAHIEVELEPA